MQTLFIDELGNFPDTVQLCGFTAAYTIEGGMLVLGLFLRCCLWVELLLDLVGINDEVFVAGVPEVDIDRTVYGFDGTLFEPLAQTVGVLAADPIFHRTILYRGEWLRGGNFNTAVELAADFLNTPVAGQELGSNGIVDFLIVRPEEHRHAVDVTGLVPFDGILDILGVEGEIDGIIFKEFTVLVLCGAGQREIVELAETALFFQKLIPADMDVLDGFKGSI